MFQPGVKRTLEIKNDQVYRHSLISIKTLKFAICRLEDTLENLSDERQRASHEKALSNHKVDLEMYRDALELYKENETCTINAYIEIGEKVVFKFPDNGYLSDRQHCAKYLKIDGVYTVANIDEGSWHTSIYLNEFPGLSFNSVMFGSCPDGD